MMKKYIFGIAGIALSIIISGIFGSILIYPVNPQVIKMGTLAPEGSVWHDVLRDMAEEWKEISNGAIEVRIYPGGVAGDDADMVRKMRINQLQAAALTGEGLANIALELGVFQMPMLIRTDEELDYVREKIGPKLEELVEEKGFKLLYWSEVGWVYLFSKQRVAEPEDLKPMKIWVWAGDMTWAEAMKDLGYQPVPLPATEIHTALSSGLIDTVSMTPVAALTYQYFGIADHMMEMKWGPLTAAVVISKKSWQKIPEEIRPKILESAIKAGTMAKNEIRKLEEEAIATMVDHGLTVNPITPEQEALWRSEIMKTYPKMIGPLVPEYIYLEAEAALNEYWSEGGQR